MPYAICKQRVLTALRIHELDTANFILAFLPYHSSELFTTVLSLLPTSLPHSLRFLGRYINNLQKPSREALVQEFIQNPGFFTAFGDHVLKAAKAGCHSHALISMWAAVTVQGIDGILHASASAHSELRRQREDDLCARLFPILNRALVIERAPELILGCYMIMVVLVTNSTLSNETLDALMEAVSRSLTPDTSNAGIACLAQMAQWRNLPTLPQPVMLRLLKMTDLHEILLVVSKQQSIQHLALGLFSSSEGIGDAQYRNRIDDVARTISEHDILPTAVREKVGLPSGKRASLLIDRRTYEPPTKRQRRALRPVSSTADSAHSGRAWIIPADLSADEAQINVQRQPQMDEQYAERQHTEIPDDISSFLSHSIFSHLLAQLEQLNESGEHDETFFAQHVFTLSERGRIRTLSFLVRAWCSSRLAAIRTFAVQKCEKILRGEDVSRDLCAFLVPYVLLALTDRARKTRAAASKLIVALRDFFQATDSTEHDDKNLSRVFQTMYGGHSDMPGAGSSDAVRATCSTLATQGLEECIIDSSRLGQLLPELLGNPAAQSKSPTGGKAPKLKSSHKEHFYRYMANHIASSQVPYLTTRLLGLMVSVNKIAGKPRSQYLIEVLRRFVFTPKVDLAAATGVDISPSDYSHAMLAIVHPKDEQSLSLLVQCATGANALIMEEVRSQAVTRLETLWPSLNSDTQDVLVRSLVEATRVVEGDSPISVDTQYSLRLLQSLPLPSSTLERILQELLEGLSNGYDASQSRRTDSGPSTIAAGNTSPTVEKVSFTLDLVQSNSSRVTLPLFHRLFELLTLTRTLSTKTSSELDYLMATNLDYLYSALQHLEARQALPQLDLSIVRADILVDCIRATSSTQTRNSALLLLSKLVKYDAQLVLHTVMPIFTLMTSTTARQSDDLSMHVVDTTLQSIIPPLSKKLQEQRKDIATSTADILFSFATAFDHIQPHRRLQLFSLLATSLGPQDSLFAISACLVDQKPGDAEIINFLSTMLRNFEPLTVMVTVDKYIAFVLDGLKKKHSLFQILSKTEYAEPAKDMVVSCHLRTVSSILRSGDVQGRLFQEMKNEAVAPNLRKLLSDCMEKAIMASQLSTATARLEAQQIISRLLVVFPFQYIAAAVEPLLEHTDLEICRGALTTLGKRIRSIKKPTSSAVQSVLSLLPRLARILSRHERSMLRTATLACIDCICERFGKVDPAACVDAIQAIAQSDCVTSDDTLMRTLSLQCFASAAETLDNDFVPILGMASKAADHSLRFAITRNDDRLHSACFALYSAIADHLPYLVSQQHLIDQLEGATRSAACQVVGDIEKARRHYLRLAAIKIELSIILPAVQSVWPMALSSGDTVSSSNVSATTSANSQQAIAELNELIRSSISARSKTELQRSSRAIADLFLLMLDLPSRMPAQPHSKSVIDDKQHLESDVRHNIVAYVLKINDTTFRPFFARLVEWSSTALPPSDHHGHALRLRVMFEMMHGLSEALKSIFTTYFNNVLEQAVSVLESTVAVKSAGHSTKLAVLQALTSSFKYDQDDFWQAPARFDVIAGPLISQLRTTSLDQVDIYVAPCITELATDCATPESHKTMNSMVLKLLQSDHARVRLSAIKCQESLVGRLGDDWLANLPEMLPVINELQDDDDEKVERATHRWIKSIEAVLGESLSSMLQ